MKNEVANAIPDPLLYELFRVDEDLDGKNDFYMDGEELIQLVTDFMARAHVPVPVFEDSVVVTMYAEEDYPVTVEEAIDFLENTLCVGVRQLQEKDYVHIDTMHTVK